MDRLDLAASAAIAVLLAGVFVLAVDEPSAAPPDVPAGPSAPADDARCAAEVARARGVLEGGGLAAASEAAESLLRSCPRDGDVRLLLGDVSLQRDDLPGALAHYRLAVDLEPDLLDRRAPNFQGRKLRHVVEEALEELERRRTGSARETFADALKTARYLLRRIAGSCG
jgi:tetratricopeptide (TPR) repeat protein